MTHHGVRVKNVTLDGKSKGLTSRDSLLQQPTTDRSHYLQANSINESSRNGRPHQVDHLKSPLESVNSHYSFRTQKRSRFEDTKSASLTYRRSTAPPAPATAQSSTV